MVRCVLTCVLTALAVVVLPQIVAAAEMEKGPQRGPELLFKRLDANHDGRVALDEIPDRAPQRLREMLKGADKNGDKQVSPEELAQALRGAHARAAGDSPDAFQPARPAPPGAKTGPTRPSPGHAMRGPHGRGGPPFAGPHGRGGPPCAGPHGRGGPPFAGPGGRGGPPFAGPGGRGGPPHAAWGPQHRGGPPHAGPRGRFPNPRVVFDRLDRDKDKQLSFKEFALGMRRLHGAAPQRGRPTAHGPRRPPSRKEAGPHGRKPTPPRGAGPARWGTLGVEMFKRADANRDGKIGLDEVQESRRQAFKRLLHKADKDGDHALSTKEARTLAAGAEKRVAGLRKQFFTKMIQRRDAEHERHDHDGAEHEGDEH